MSKEVILQAAKDLSGGMTYAEVKEKYHFSVEQMKQLNQEMEHAIYSMIPLLGKEGSEKVVAEIGEKIETLIKNDHLSEHDRAILEKIMKLTKSRKI